MTIINRHNKVKTDESGHSKGFSFVQFDQEEAAQNAIEKLNGMCPNDKPNYVGHLHHKLERDNTSITAKLNYVFVKSLVESTTDHQTKKIGKFGKTTSTIVMAAHDRKLKCFGFVNFENSDDVA